MAEMWIKKSFFTVKIPLIAPTLGGPGPPCFIYWGGGGGPPPLFYILGGAGPPSSYSYDYFLKGYLNILLTMLIDSLNSCSGVGMGGGGGGGGRDTPPPNFF